jgi:hypothetical protein
MPLITQRTPQARDISDDTIGTDDTLPFTAAEELGVDGVIDEPRSRF